MERSAADAPGLLHDPELDARDRFAGSVRLLYSKPTTRIVALRTTGIHDPRGGEDTPRLGRGEVALPEPLAQVAQALRDQQLTRTGTDGWLWPARRQHIIADRLQQRLKRHGIERSREGRHAALSRLPRGSGTDPCRADRDPSVTRGRVGSPGRVDIRRLRRSPPGRLSRLEKQPSTDGTWIGLTLADAVIWVIAEFQIGTAAFVPGRYGGQARPTGRVDAVS